MCESCGSKVHDTHKEWVCLHSHSEHSILDGYAKIEDYVDLAKERGASGFGLTDHGTCSGLYDMINLCNEAGIKPVPGFEAYVAPENPEGAKAKKPIFYGKDGIKAPKYDVGSNGAALHLTLFAYNKKGLQNLMKLTSMAWEKEHFYSKPRIDTEMLFAHSEGVIVTTGCPSSEISTRFLLGQDDKAYEYASRLKSVFGENMYVELMDHSMENEDMERILVPKLMKLAKDLDLPLLATNDCHYVRKEDADDHERMLALQTQRKMSEPSFNEGGTRFAFSGPEYYMKTDAEMRAIFPEDKFPGAVDNTFDLVERCDQIELDYDPHLRPEIDIPEGETPVSYLKKLIKEGFKKKRGHQDKETQQESLKRIKEEFEVIHSNDFISYFLVVNDYIQWAHDNGISTGKGRGCFTTNSDVLLSNAHELPISSVKKGDIVHIFDNNDSIVDEHFVYTVENEDMVRLELKNGKTIEVTPDHLFLTANNGYVKAEELTKSAVLLGQYDGTELEFNDFDELESLVEYPYVTTITQQDKEVAITVPDQGFHLALSFAEVSGSEYTVESVTIDVKGKVVTVPMITLMSETTDGFDLMVAPDGVFKTNEPMISLVGDREVTILSQTAARSLLMGEKSQSPVYIERIENFVYTGEVHDLRLPGDYNYTVGGVLVHNSVGGSEIAYVLDISDTDPIRYDLLFERFLSPGRGSVYTIEYEDGTIEEVSVSDKVFVIKGEEYYERYIHELEDGDEIVDKSEIPTEAIVHAIGK